ncbi:unnamed protein product [Coffea canephora]|uniref:Uncharacterized protein n=1 Tax=Coffea canephora TaxID=49390 RepID=A0A068USV1_COFCA|nr:unnamed protein product [Coffea canephora]
MYEFFHFGAGYTGNFFAYSLDHQLLPGISFSLKFNRSLVAIAFILSKVSAEFLFLFFFPHIILWLKCIWLPCVLDTSYSHIIASLMPGT